MPGRLPALRHAVRRNGRGCAGPLHQARAGRGVTDVVGQALAYAAAGWPVFPTRPGADPCPEPEPGRCPCKRPLTEHGCLDASTDPAGDPRVVAPLAARRTWPSPPARRAPTSSTSTSSRTATDGPHSTASRPPGCSPGPVRWSGRPAAACTRTTRAPASATGSCPGITSTSGRRAATCWPRRAACTASPYELLDHRGGAAGRLDWQAAARLLDPPRAPARPHGRATGDLGKLAAWVAAQPEGNRNDGLYWAACRAIESGLDPGGLADAAVQAGLADTEAHRTIDSARRASR